MENGSMLIILLNLCFRYSDFAESFAPRASEYFKMLGMRQSVNSDL